VVLLGALAAYSFAVVAGARAGTPEILRQARQPGPYSLIFEDLSDWQKQALLAVEDPNYTRHHGIDLETPGAGITTITQGLAKRLYFHPFKPGFRKLKLMLIARYVLDPALSKDEQLELFLNHVYLGTSAGKPVIGLGAAAREYYHKPFQDLDGQEYLSLVAMIIAPNTFHVLHHPETNAERTRRIQKVVSGEYKPRSLMDLYYGELDPETQKGLAPASYFPPRGGAPDTNTKE